MVFGVSEFKYAILIFKGARGCHGNQIWAKISQNCTDFSSVQDIETLFACMVGFSGSANSNMLSEFSREQRELPWQPNLGQKSQNCTYFTSIQDIEKLFACKVGSSGSANSNMPSEFLREQRQLPWQPNLGKNKSKLHLFQFCTRYRDTFCT